MPLVEEHISLSLFSLTDTHIPLCHLPQGGPALCRLGLASVGTSCANANSLRGLLSPQVQRGAGLHLLGPLGCRGERGLGAGLSALLSLGLQLECGWPMLILCLMLYLLLEGSLFFKLYIYKNRSYTVYIKISRW